ncbi:hypothetical protein MTR67_028994 [Solanum verrucosum]|uniref:FAR1 domain-containing protein n=1 Tax=Solanum verrucosum TaxID=315347 RepID=A0AAF0R3F2_SOLVR|nr:hypothetical protein MTR67_028994 [Solanum verrucosum]
MYRLIHMDFVVDDHVSGDEEEGTVVELRTVDENLIGGSSSEEALHQVHDVKVDEDLPEREDLLLEEAQSLNNSTSDEPFVGLEFESEAAAHAFYNAYATRVGFIIRVSKLSRSRRDGSAIGRALVCNKEGFRMPDKREKIVRQRAETRVGCRAMILVRKISSGKWVVTKFVKEHSHPLCPGKGRRDLIYDQYPNEHDKIRELSQQLAAEKKRSATYKRHLEMIFEHIEEHNQSLSKKIQDIVHNLSLDASRITLRHIPKGLRTLYPPGLHLWSGIISMDVQVLEDNGTRSVESSAEGQVSTSEADRTQEPNEGMIFESEEAARAYYDEYAGMTGFITRVLSSRKSERDGSIISRGLGCRGIPDNQRPDEKDKRIQELTAELRIKKRLTAAYREQLLSLMKDVESHSEHLSTKVQAVQSILKELEAKRQELSNHSRRHN